MGECKLLVIAPTVVRVPCKLIQTSAACPVTVVSCSALTCVCASPMYLGLHRDCTSCLHVDGMHGSYKQFSVYSIDQQ